MSAAIWTLGHSTRSLEEFLEVLVAHRIEAVADVRRFPASRRLPQFGRESLERALGESGIAYRWLPALGGRRRSSADSPNTGWRHAAFRAYADHMASEEFAQGFSELTAMAEGLRTAMMCAELLWWRCHRRLVSDLFVSLGTEVFHIRDAKACEAHRLAPPARLVNGTLSYADNGASFRKASNATD